ncbi:tripartite tricarboxylate transporter permease [Aestuariivirga sp.]|uniref:tripartite tricarboxylate transporter permease n=1 Tax=Aestuariivirga sp. TaxID=2650926 RepID=UPI00391B7633
MIEMLPSDYVELLLPLLLGTGTGFIVGLVPGIGGRIGILLCLPFATVFGPLGGAVFLFSMHAVVHTSSSIPTIAFGLPTSGADAATVLDGYPLARRGAAGAALGASLSASVLGGVIGALAFLACIPVARALMAWLGPPEFLLLSLAGLFMIPLLSGNLVTGAASAALGLLAASVGLDVLTGTSRFTFGYPQLLGGLDLAAVIGGLFVVPEMLARWHHAEKANRIALATTIHDVMSGLWATFWHLRLVAVSSFYGIVVGIMPGLGASVSVWMSYSYATRHVKSDVPYGEGAIPGVIAPETANNAKEGGAMVPTLFFGIPGSSSMAVMLGALTVVGQPVGPQLLTSDIATSFTLAATILLANLVAIPMFFAVVPSLVRLAALRRDYLVPVAISLSLFAALYQDLHVLTLVQFALGGALGLLLQMFGWSRAAFLLGFIMGPLAETSYIQSSQIWGWWMFARPAFLVMLLGFGFAVARAMLSRPRHARKGLAPQDGWLALLLLPLFVAGVAGALRLPGNASQVPLMVSAFGLAATAFIALSSAFRKSLRPRQLQRFNHLPLMVLYCVGVPVLGLPAASAIFTATIMRDAKAAWATALCWGIAVSLFQLAFLSLVADLSFESLITGWLLAGRF